MARHGRTDRYPDHGRFATSAMAEGAIEGDASLYEVISRYSTDFQFSRFDAMPLQAFFPSLPLAPAPAPPFQPPPRARRPQRPSKWLLVGDATSPPRRLSTGGRSVGSNEMQL